jgi:hypothetical protein
MMDFNISAIIGLIMRCIGALILILYVVPKAFTEALRPKDWLTGLRAQLLIFFSLAIVASVPAIVYQTLRIYGIDSLDLRNFASISGNLSFLLICILSAMLYNYRRKE